MKPESDSQLEALLHAELKKLPSFSAPPAMARNVLEILAARTRRPWWCYSWWDWPSAAKAAFLALAILIVGMASQGGVILNRGIAGYSDQVTARLSPVASVWETTETFHNALALVWEKAGQPFLIYGLIAGGILYLGFLALGTVCFRYVLRRSPGYALIIRP